MNTPFMPEQPDKKNSWKSLAGNLFGMEFDDAFDLDELDLDSVADVVDQVSAAEDQCEHDCSCDHDHDQQDHDGSEEAVPLPLTASRNPESPARKQPQEQVKMKEEKKSNRTSSSDRSLYEDEDLFGFGIMLNKLEEELDSEEDVDDAGDTDDADDSYEEYEDELSGEPALLEADSAPVSTEESDEVVAGKMEDEISLEDFDFDFDFEEEEDSQPEPVKKTQPTTQAPAKATANAPRAEKPTAEAEAEAEAAPPKKAGKSADDDDFWSSLEEWDWNKESSGRSEKGKRGRRGPSRRSETPALVEEDDAAELVAETAAETGEEEDTTEEQEQTTGPRRRRSRRRRRSPSKETADTDVTASAAESTAEEIDPDLIDRLWSDEEEDVAVTPAASPPAEPKRISREEHNRSRGRGRTDAAARSSSSEPRGNQSKPQPESARKAPAKEVGTADDDSSDTDHEDHKGKVVPTWTEAIGLIVRRRDTGGGDRGRSRRDQGNRRQEGGRSEERSGQRRRPRQSDQ